MDMDQTSRRPESAARSLINDLLAKVDRAPIEIPIPDKPGWTLRIKPQIDDSQMRRWTKTAAGTDGNVDQLTLSRLVIAELCIAICKDGEPVLDADGAPLSFGSPELRDGSPSLKRASNADMVSAIFGNPVHVMQAGQVITEAVGEAAPSKSSSLP